MIIQLLLLVAGLLLLVKGAGWLVDGATALAKKYNIPDLAIGLTIVAFGTSAPELVVNAFAASNGFDGIVFGNVIGSNNFNLFVILGISGLIMPLAVHSGTVWKEIPLSLLAAVLLFLLAGNFSLGAGILSQIDGLILLCFFAAFLYYVYRQLRTDPANIEIKHKHVAGHIIFFLLVGGLAGLVAGGKFVVDSAVKIASELGVEQKIIGLTIVAAGTSLPELATSVVAALKKNADIAVGNIIGSNIFNIFLILAVSSLIRPLNYDPAFNKDLLLLSGGTIFLFIAMFTGKKKQLDRWEAGVLLLAFAGYITYMLRTV
ncbi:MAG: calcium/sodium antiporter [Bacteroidales bacterium]|nr:calcium/sodium antiporter [Bacteroidales bacterium]